MAVQKRSFLGIELNAAEIHIAEVQGNWPDVQVLRAHHAPMPAGIMEGGQILDTARLGDHLRALLRIMHAGTRDAVIGLPVRALFTRILDLPPLPGDEMRVIIAGELSHHYTLRPEDDTFDFTPIHIPSKTVEEGQTVLVMAADAMVVTGYNEVAERAGLCLIALEPLPIALLRALLPQLQQHPDALCVLIQHGDVEIAIVENGFLRLYRRLDISSDDLLASPEGNPFDPREDYLLTPAQTAFTSSFNLTSLNSLAMELQRSLDYYQREFLPVQPIGCVLLATSHPELDGLAETLAEALSLPVLSAGLLNDTLVANIECFDLKAPFDPVRAGAIGLAMRELHDLPAAMPRLNLNHRRRSPASDTTVRRRLTLSLMASILLLVCGTFTALRIGLHANRLSHEVSHLEEDIQAMQQDKQTRLDAIQTRENLLRMLSQEGFAFPRYMDSITDAVSPQAGLLEVSLNRSGQFFIVGEATDGKAIISTLEGIKQSPFLEKTSLNSFDSTQAQATPGKLVRFQITSQLLGFGPTQTAHN